MIHKITNVTVSGKNKCSRPKLPRPKKTTKAKQSKKFNIHKETICISAEAMYKNYTDQIKVKLLNPIIESKMLGKAFKILVSTNLPEEFREYSNKDGIHILDIRTAMSDISKKFEALPSNSEPKLYPQKYPWNLERFAIKEASIFSNNVLHLDTDVECHDLELLYEKLLNLKKGKFIYTNQGIYEYEENVPDRFEYHSLYEKALGFNFSPERYAVHDGPVTFFRAKDRKEIMQYIYMWNQITDYGYLKPHGFGYENAECGNRSLTNALTDFFIQHVDLPLIPNHDYTIRYTK